MQSRRNSISHIQHQVIPHWVQDIALQPPKFDPGRWSKSKLSWFLQTIFLCFHSTIGTFFYGSCCRFTSRTEDIIPYLSSMNKLFYSSLSFSRIDLRRMLDYRCHYFHFDMDKYPLTHLPKHFYNFDRMSSTSSINQSMNNEIFHFVQSYPATNG